VVKKNESILTFILVKGFKMKLNN